MKKMNLCDYVSQKAEEKHRGFGEIVKIIFREEQKGNPFTHEKFVSARERAELVTFGDSHMTDVMEYAILQHRQKKHSEIHIDRLKELEPLLSAEEIKIGTMDFWNS